MPNQRTCIGCHKKDHRSAFLRIIARDGELVIDEKQNSEGRGAYICPNQSCLDRAIKKRAFGYRLKQKLNPTSVSNFQALFPKKPL